MPNESNLWGLLKSNLSEVHWQRIEGNTGVPDINGCYDSVDFWIEGKVVRSGFAVRFRPGQVAWLILRARANGRCFVLVRYEPTRELLLYPGHQALELKEKGVRLEPWLRLPMPYDYARLLETLSGVAVKPRRPRHKRRDPNGPLAGQRAFPSWGLADVG